jgi:DNA-binding NarL/FixJ family response regulator
MTSGKILVIDDSEPILARIQAALSGADFEVVTTTQTVGNGRHLKTCDLVIIDYHMPGLDGSDVLRSLRAAASDASAVFYLYTSDDKIADRYVDLGFDGSFTSKGDMTQLVAQVRAAFRSIRLRSLAAGKSRR